MVPEQVYPRSKYDPKTTPQLVKWMARSGLTEQEIADELGINRSTLTRWKQRYPDHTEALNQSRNFVDSLVEDALLKRALGYEYEETKMIITGEGNAQRRRVERTTKTMAPDVTAQIFWLKNRQPDKWRDKPIADATDAPLKDLVEVLRQSRAGGDKA